MAFNLKRHSEDPHFQAKAKISVTEAEKAAIDKYSGVMLQREYGFAKGNPFILLIFITKIKICKLRLPLMLKMGQSLGVEEELYQIGPNRTF